MIKLFYPIHVCWEPTTGSELTQPLSDRYALKWHKLMEAMITYSLSYYNHFLWVPFID